MARDTIVDRFVHQCAAQPAAPALWHKVGNTWKHITWAGYGEAVRRFAGALLAKGLEPGDAVAIMSYNCPEWLYADVGAMMARAVPAGIYHTSTQEQACYVANHCQAKVLVIEDASLWEQLDLESCRDALEHTSTIVMIRDAEAVDHPDVIAFDDFLALGDEQQEAVEARMSELRGDDLGTLIYTSGTTGPPKGVMLSHENLAWTSGAAIEAFGGDVNPNDAVVSYLPLSHIAEQMFSIHLPLTAGAPVWFAESMPKLRDALVAARPTIFLGVPRVWEKFRNALEGRLAEASGLKATIVAWSRDVLLRANRIIVEKGEEGLPIGLKLQYRAAQKLFASKLQEQLGIDEMRVAVSGAAPIGRDVLEFFLSCDLIIHEVYGQSEDTGPTTFNFPTPGVRRIGTVGKPFPGVEVKLGDDGEILVRGKNVFQGYYRMPEETEETLVDGWLHSGDIGVFDADGFLCITDRKKDLIITAGGKNVAPQLIEKPLRAIDGIGQAVVIGDRRKFLSALLTLDPERAPGLAAEHGWPSDLEELAEHPEFRDFVQREVDRINEELARYETIKKFALLPHDFTLESGELTPTQKLKRKPIAEHYADVIEGFYEGLS